MSAMDEIRGAVVIALCKAEPDGTDYRAVAETMFPHSKLISSRRRSLLAYRPLIYKAFQEVVSEKLGVWKMKPKHPDNCVLTEEGRQQFLPVLKSHLSAEQFQRMRGTVAPRAQP